MSSPVSSPPPKRIRLAPIAVILVIIIVLAFGVCAANLNFEGPTPPIAQAAVTIEALCLVGLVILAIIAIVRSNRTR